jgi:hypothetical protein
MTQQQFEALTGKKISEKEFKHAESIWMMTDTIGVREFCKLYTKLNLGLLVKGMVAMDNDLEKEKKKRQAAETRSAELERKIERLETLL